MTQDTSFEKHPPAEGERTYFFVGSKASDTTYGTHCVGTCECGKNFRMTRGAMPIGPDGDDEIWVYSGYCTCGDRYIRAVK